MMSIQGINTKELEEGEGVHTIWSLRLETEVEEEEIITESGILTETENVET